MVNTRGYFLVAKQIFTSPLTTQKPASWLKIFLYILGNVDWEDGPGRGSETFIFNASIAGYGKPLYGVTKNDWYRCLAWLSQEEVITTEANGRGTKITVINYDKYQDPRSYTATPPAQEPTATPPAKPTRIKKAAPATTWMTPYLNVWREKMGGEPPEGIIAHHFKEIHKEHGPAKVAEHFRNYLAKIESPNYISIPKFLATFDTWKNDKSRIKTTPKIDTEYILRTIVETLRDIPEEDLLSKFTSIKQQYGHLLNSKGENLVAEAWSIVEFQRSHKKCASA